MHGGSKEPLGAMQAWKNLNTYLALRAVHPRAQTIPAMVNKTLGFRIFIMALEEPSGSRIGRNSELHAPAVDIHESSFSRSQEASPNGSSLELPMFEFDYSLRTELHPCAVDVLESSLFRAREASPENPSPESPTPKQVREYTGNENYGSVALTDL